MSKIVFLCWFSFLIVITFQLTISQTVSNNRVKEKINIDGILDETDWSYSESLTNFTQFKPEYGKKSGFSTIVKLLYDDEEINGYND